jgi:M6 family metalloprotease-like protein
MVRRAQAVANRIVRLLGFVAVLSVLLTQLGPAEVTAQVGAEPKGESARRQDLYTLSGTLVILAETTDNPGQASLHRFEALAQSVNWYYQLNAYGQVSYHFTFMDADGPEGEDDWYSLGASMAPYVGHEEEFTTAALRQALAGADLPEAAYLERAVVVCPARQELGTARALYAMAVAEPEDYAITVQTAEHTTRLYVANLVLVSAEDDLGTWVHELGHTLGSKYTSPNGQRRLTDRYQYPQPERRFGHVGPWDLMGTGSRWGNPQGTSPTHMSSYTKEAAGWLHYAPAHFDVDYALTALETQKLGDAALRLDDPASDDPRSYYLIEARDSSAFFGTPESGVMLYHVTYDAEARHAVVEIVSPQQGARTTTQSGAEFERPTLHGAGLPG